MEPPIKPDTSDCCNSGCNPCILDVYEQQLRIYEKKKLCTPRMYTNCISPSSFSIFELIKIEDQYKDAFLYTFKYIQPLRDTQSNNLQLGLLYESGQHFLMKAENNGEEFTRAYTPIPNDNNGPLEFSSLIKIYENGKMSDYLKGIQIGTKTLWRGPYGDFKIDYNLKNLLLIAQGTGIAPIYSIIHDIVNNEDCYTFLKLFYCCRNCDNIYLRDQLYNLSSCWNFSYEIFLSVPDNMFLKYNEVIHQNKLQFCDIRSYLNKGNTNIVICGSEMFNGIMKKYILDCDMKKENVFTFD